MLCARAAQWEGIAPLIMRFHRRTLSLADKMHYAHGKHVAELTPVEAAESGVERRSEADDVGAL